MPAYNRGDASLESYLVKIIAALCRMNGGELRIRGDIIDIIDQPVTLLKDWDSGTQELVLRTHLGSFGEVFRAIPEKQPVKEVIAASPVSHDAPPGPPPQHAPHAPKASTMDDEKLADLERKLTKRRVASLIVQDLRNRQRPEEP